MPIATSYEIANDREFAAAIRKSQKKSSDLRIPFALVADDFYTSEKAIWQLGSRGRYPDLADSTKADRRRRGQPLYPILRRTGKLERSMTNPRDTNAIIVIGRKVLVIGTKATVKTRKGNVPYPIFHQLGTKSIPIRKFLFIGPESSFSLGGSPVNSQKGRLVRWLRILKDNTVEDSTSFANKA